MRYGSTFVWDACLRSCVRGLCRDEVYWQTHLGSDGLLSLWLFGVLMVPEALGAERRVLEFHYCVARRDIYCCTYGPCVPRALVKTSPQSHET